MRWQSWEVATASVVAATTTLLFAGQAEAISMDKLKAWTTGFKVLNLDTEAIFADRKHIKPINISAFGENVVVDMKVSQAIIGDDASGVPDNIGNDLFTGTIRGQEEDPESFASATYWPSGITGRVTFRAKKGNHEVFHVDKLDGSNMTVIYRDEDVKKTATTAAATESNDNGATGRHGHDHGHRHGSSRDRLRRRDEIKRSLRKRLAAGSDCPLAIVADSSFAAKFKQDTVKQMASILNDAGGIFLRNFDVGIPILVAIIDTQDKIKLQQNGIGSKGNISLALDQLSSAVNGSLIPAKIKDSVCTTHMFTAREFGVTLGLAFVGTPDKNADGGICEGSSATGVTTSLADDGTQLPISSWVTTVTHEIGHNFGASHDEDVGCGGQRHIMAAAVEVGGPPVNTFSDCSIRDINAVLATKATCFKPRKK